MNITFIKQDNNPHLLLIMAGWGMDANPFHDLSHPGYDIAVTWDYTHESLDKAALSPYREIVVIAWSMGVMECARIIPGSGLPVTLTIAVNGTMTPVDNSTGIPEAIFNGTLETLSIETLTRFNRRMCGSAERYKEFTGISPRRSVESLRQELEILGNRATENAKPSDMRWDMAVIGSRDMIFPAANQQKAWNEIATLTVDCPHLPDFQSIIKKFVIDKKRVADRFDNTRDTYDNAARLQHNVANRLAVNLLKKTGQRKHFSDAIEIGAGSGRLTRLYTPSLDIRRLQLWDLAPMDPDLVPQGATMISDDAEARLFEVPDNSTDLVISASTLQWFNSPVNAIIQIKRILKPGGIAAISLYTQGTYASLAEATGVSINYISPLRVKEAVKQDCDIDLFTVDNDCQNFDSSRDLIEHMRITGVNAAGTTSNATLRKILTDNTLKQLEYNSTTIIFTKR